MASRIRDFFFEQSQLPEACATDFWYEDHGFEASRTKDKPRYIKLEEYQTEESFLSSAPTYLSYVSEVATFFRNTTMPQRFKFRQDDAPDTFVLGMYTSKDMSLVPRLPRDWKDKTERDHDRRFAETIFALIVKSYFARGHLIDAERLFERLFSENREARKSEQILIPSLGFSPDRISEFLSALIYDVDYSRAFRNDANLREKYSVTLNEHGRAAYLRSTPKPVEQEEEEATGIANYYAAFLKFLGNEKEGVAEERSHQVEEDKLDKGKLPAIFDGTLDRDAMARALNAAMTEQGLSVRKAADAAEVSRTDIERISKGSATLDKSADVLRNLGYELHVEVRKLDEP